jgi:hypothetical protein
LENEQRISGEKVYAKASFLRQQIQTPGNRRRVLPNRQRMTRPDVWAQAVPENLNARQSGRRYFEAGDLTILLLGRTGDFATGLRQGEENG